MADAVVRYGNAGRGGHVIAERTSELVYHARETVAEFFDAKVENTIFTLNCTHALNVAIQGILKSGDHVIFSDLEHNSVYRPIMALARAGKVTYSMLEVSADNSETLRRLAGLVRPNTKAVVCTIASNVTGQILPYREIAQFCRSRNICMIADGAQACGILPLSLERDGMHILCTAGHKGLYGSTGTGILMTDCTFPIQPLMQGGRQCFPQSGAAGLFAGSSGMRHAERDRSRVPLCRHRLCAAADGGRFVPSREPPLPAALRCTGGDTGDHGLPAAGRGICAHCFLYGGRCFAGRNRRLPEPAGVLSACRTALCTAGSRKAGHQGRNSSVRSVGVQQGIRYAAAGGKPEKLCQYSEKSRKLIEKFR